MSKGTPSHGVNILAYVAQGQSLGIICQDYMALKDPKAKPLGPLFRGKELPHDATPTTSDFLYYYHQLVRTRLGSRT